MRSKQHFNQLSHKYTCLKQQVFEMMFCGNAVRIHNQALNRVESSQCDSHLFLVSCSSSALCPTRQIIAISWCPRCELIPCQKCRMKSSRTPGDCGWANSTSTICQQNVSFMHFIKTTCTIMHSLFSPIMKYFPHVHLFLFSQGPITDLLRCSSCWCSPVT